VLIVGGLVFAGMKNGSSVSGQVVAPRVSASQPVETDLAVVTGEDSILGAADDKISVLKFSDFECVFCAQAAQTTVVELKNSPEFLEGKINYIYKHFPLHSIHPHAQKAAEASVCAQRQGAFWEYHDLLFANQHALSDSDLKDYAMQVGIDSEIFATCLDSGAAS